MCTVQYVHVHVVDWAWSSHFIVPRVLACAGRANNTVLVRDLNRTNVHSFLCFKPSFVMGVEGEVFCLLQGHLFTLYLSIRTTVFSTCILAKGKLKAFSFLFAMSWRHYRHLLDVVVVVEIYVLRYHPVSYWLFLQRTGILWRLLRKVEAL